MSISNLEVPSNVVNEEYDLYVNSLTANNLVYTDAEVDTLYVNNIIALDGPSVNLLGIDITTTPVVMTLPTSSASNGIKLPTVGGTASLLNYYEENTFASTIGNMWASPLAVTIKMIRIGKFISITFLGATGASTGTP